MNTATPPMDGPASESDAAHEQALDRWATAFAVMASEAMRDWTDATGVLSQACMLVATKHITPLQFAEAQLSSAEDLYARISAQTKGHCE